MEFLHKHLAAEVAAAVQEIAHTHSLSLSLSLSLSIHSIAFMSIDGYLLVIVVF
jgi:hypothetical protein